MSHNCIRKGKILKKNNNLQTRNAGLRAEQEMRDLVPNKKKHRQNIAYFIITM